MASDSTAFPGGTSTIPSTGQMALRSLAPASPWRRFFLWLQVVSIFLFIELALWAPDRTLRNRWSLAAMFTILLLVLIDRPSRERLGLRWPKTFGASVVLGVGFAMVMSMVILVNLAGGPIPANPTWPSLQSAWGYLIWALMQEFVLQSFFFNRFEELYGSENAVWIAATLFATAHLPSPILTTATLIGALFFCEMYRRYRSIYPIGIIHAMLGLTVFLVTPDSLLHHMRVGIGYLRY
jgi:membrane protease YdiL (CAAX protease family)